MDIPSILSRQKAFFRTQTTKDLSFRIAALKKLREEIIKREKDISQALYADFKKSEFEAVLTETGYVLSDLNLVLRKLAGWTKPRRVLPVLLNFPSTGRLYKEPYGSVLIIAPWNYPFQLVFSPLIGAIAAGNTAVVKPSELTEHTSRVIREIIAAVFRPEHVTVVEGGVSVSTELLNERWDYIFFTGSIPVGRIVAKAAAENLTPVTLELGGKSPCIIDETADLRMAAKRIVWGKFVNCGQTCIAPDYILVQDKVKDVFTGFLKDEIDHAYGRDPKLSAD